MIGEIFAAHPWLGPLAWQSTLCLAAGLGGSFLLRRHAVRAHQVLLLGLVAAVLIPALSQIVKRNQWGLLVAERAVATPERRPLPAPADFVIPDQPMVTEPASPLPPTRAPEAAPAPARTRFEWTRTVLPTWLAISSVLLLRLAIQFLLGRRLARWSEAVDDVQLRHMMEAAKSKLGIQSEVGVRASAQTRSPVIWCWGRRPVLLVPPEPRSNEGLDWPSILCHELAHAKRHDHVSGLFAELMVRALPWQPLLWWARQRLAALSEEACDDWVIASGQRATGYAQTLLGLTAQGQAALLPGVVTSRRGLAGRVRRIVEDGCGNPRPGLRWTLAVVALAGGVSLSLAFAQTRPAPRAVADTTPSAASRDQLNKILDAMLYYDRALLPLALHMESDLYNLDAPAGSQHNQTYVFEQRLDGKRLDCLMNVYRLRDGEFQHQQVNRRVFTGEQFVYRQQEINNRSIPLLASLCPKEEATRILGANTMWGSTLLGYLPGDQKPVASLLKNAADVTLRRDREDVDGFACYVIEGKTDHGMYKLWIDPEHDFRIRRAIIDKGPDDLSGGRPLSQGMAEGARDRTLTSIHTEISGVKLEKIGGHFIATVECTTTTFRTVTGTESHGKGVVRRSQIDPNPDFDKLGAFVMDGIPEGAPVFNSDPNDPTYAYEWHNGKAVSVAPDGGTIVGRIQLAGQADLRTFLTDRRHFEARFTLVSTTGSARGRNFQSITLAPGKNGAFRVKDVPPGEYRLQLVLTHLILERVPSGGYVPRDKLLAKAERDATIPEGKDAAQKIVDLGVIEMALSSPPESPGGTNAGTGAETAAPADKKLPVDQDKISLRLVDPNGWPASPPTAGRKQFEEVYRLADGEVLKRIAPPYLPERMEHYPGGRDRTMPRDFEQRLTMVFLWDGQLRVWGASTSPANPLGSVLSSVLRLQSYEYEGPKALLDLRLPPGDWIIRDKVPPEVKLRALEELVARELGRTIRFEKRTVKREVLIATGRFQFHPPVGTYENTAVHLYATATDPTESAGGGTAFSVGEFLQKLGNVVHVPVINRAEPKGSLPIPYRHHHSAYLGVIEDPRERAGELKVLLEHLTAQTELKFEIRKEPVEVWYVTE